MFAIGEFSRATGLSVKTLRHYHAEGLLVPSQVDERTGYRYYDAELADRARVIQRLRGFGFSLAEIALMLEGADDQAELLEHLERRRREIGEQLGRLREVDASLRTIITAEREARETMATTSYEVEEKTIPPVQIAGIRMTGRYSECSKGFAALGKRFGRHIAGKALLLIYDREYREDDADFEVCMPVRKGTGDGTVSVRTIPGGRCVSLMHRGPYEDLGRSYEKIMSYVSERGYEVAMPTREVYHKGPGMVLKGNPRNYLTELQLLIEEGAGEVDGSPARGEHTD